MKFAFLFGLMMFAVACASQASPIALPTATISPTIITPKTATPTVSVTPTTPPLPTLTPYPLTNLFQSNPKLIREPDLAIAYSYNLLMLRAYEWGLSYDNALYSPVEFPDGSMGAFVAIGFSGVTRGYKFLYKIVEENRFRLIQLTQDEYDWGINWGSSPQILNGEILLNFPQLLVASDGKAVHLIQVSGVGHMGVGLIDDGHFEILKINNDGFTVIFSGSRLTGIYQGYPGDENEYHYQYLDLDGDGNKEIIQDGEECNVVENADYTWKRINCKTVHKVYKYNGEEYVKQP